jgi:hypothetical protein
MLEKQMSYHLSHIPVHFALVILEMGSCELLAQAGLEAQASCFQPPK